MKTLFDDLESETPDWAQDCFYCRPDEFGRYNKKWHLAEHLPLTCAVCGKTVPNRLLAENSHKVCLGSSRSHNALLCTSLSLKLNHLTYAKLNNQEPRVEDLIALDLGWTILDDGTQVPPADWPDGSHATECVLITKEEATD